MKKLFPNILIFALLISCSKMPSTVQVHTTETATTQPTETVLPTQTETTLLASTPTPMAVVTHTPHPLALNEFNTGKEMKLLNTFGTGTPYDIKFSPDGSLLAIATGRGVYFYDGETFEEVGFLDVNDSVSAIAFNPNGETIALAVDGKTSIWNIKSGQKLIDFSDTMIHVDKIAYSSTGYVASIGDNCQGCGDAVEILFIWKEETGEKIFEEKEFWSTTRALEFSSDGKTLYYNGNEGLTRLEVEDLTKFPYKLRPYFVSDLLLDEYSKKIYVFNYESVAIVDLQNNTTQTFDTCEPPNYFPPVKSQSIGTCSANGKAILFDIESGREISNITIDIDSDILLTINPKGDRVVYSNKNNFIVVDLQSNAVIKTIPMNNFDYSQAGIIDINGQEYYVLATINNEDKIDIFDIESGEVISTLTIDDAYIHDFSFAPDRKTAATLHDNKLSIWNIERQEIIYELRINHIGRFTLAFSPNGKIVFLGGPGDYIIAVDIQQRIDEKISIDGDANNYRFPLADDKFQFTNDGDLLLLNYEVNADIFSPFFSDALSNKKISLPYSFEANYEGIETFVIDFENKYLATGTINGILIWEIPNSNLLFTLNKHEIWGGDGFKGSIRTLLFSPFSNLLVSIGWDGTTRLWNAKAGTELRILNVCCSASFTPDGRYFVTAGDGVIRVWGIP